MIVVLLMLYVCQGEFRERVREGGRISIQGMFSNGSKLEFWEEVTHIFSPVSPGETRLEGGWSAP